MPRSKGKRGAELTEEQEAEYLQFHQNVQAIADRWEKDANAGAPQAALSEAAECASYATRQKDLRPVGATGLC
ncbi:uncharacterized protein JCM6883_002479 [Sporobolomyces salmoneus]|uniref:uncharacterized protein n=1 Tax=Sporobolomyces salmoneus TaxID=183962 RepID=UPI0031758265